MVGYNKHLAAVSGNPIDGRKVAILLQREVHLNTAVWRSQIVQVGPVVVLHSTVYGIRPIVGETVY